MILGFAPVLHYLSWVLSRASVLAVDGGNQMPCAPKDSAPCSECPALNSCPLPHFRMSEKSLLQKCVRETATSEAENIAHACSLSCLWPVCAVP